MSVCEGRYYRHMSGEVIHILSGVGNPGSTKYFECEKPDGSRLILGAMDEDGWEEISLGSWLASIGLPMMSEDIELFSDDTLKVLAMARSY